MRVRQGKIDNPFLIDDRNGLDMGAKRVLDYVFGDGDYYVVGQKPCLSWSFGPSPSKQLESYTVVDRDNRTHVLYFQKVLPDCPRPRLEKAIRENEYFPDEHMFTPIQQQDSILFNDFGDNFPSVESIDPEINKSIMDKVDTEKRLEEIDQDNAEFNADDELTAKRIEREINDKLSGDKKPQKPKTERGRGKKIIDGK